MGGAKRIANKSPDRGAKGEDAESEPANETTPGVGSSTAPDLPHITRGGTFSTALAELPTFSPDLVSILQFAFPDHGFCTMRSDSNFPCALTYRERPPAIMRSEYSDTRSASGFTHTRFDSPASNWSSCISDADDAVSLRDYPFSYRIAPYLQHVASKAPTLPFPTLDYRWGVMPNSGER